VKKLAQEQKAKLTYLYRELVKIEKNPFWAYRLDHPDHPMVQTLIRTREKILAEIKELKGDTSHPG